MKMLRKIAITDDILISTNVAENDYAEYSAATTYGVGDTIIVIATHKIYESLRSTNLNHYPPTNLTGGTPYWLEIGATNAWKCFDGKVGSQTTRSETITYSFVSSLASGISFLNLEGLTVNVLMTDSVDGVIIDKTFDLISTSNITNAFEYFFEPFYLTENVFVNFVDELPPYSEAQIDITISNPGGTAKVGEIVLGKIAFVGYPQYGANVGVTNYSVKELDDFGNYQILERPTSKRGAYELWIPSEQVEFVMNLLPDYETTPAVWIPTEAPVLSSALIIYGFVKDWNISVDHLEVSICSLEIEGLT